MKKTNEKSSFKKKIKCVVLNDVKFEMPFRQLDLDVYWAIGYTKLSVWVKLFGIHHYSDGI